MSTFLKIALSFDKRQKTREFPDLIYNADGDSTMLATFSPPIAPEQA